MGNEDKFGERLARLETNQEHLLKSVDQLSALVQQQNELVFQAKGAKWMLVGMAGVSGAVTAFATKWLPFMQAVTPR